MPDSDRPSPASEPISDVGDDTRLNRTLPTGMLLPGLAGKDSVRLPGEKLGRYVVIDVLGKGGMGIVYKAVDPELGRWVAIKVVRVRDNARGGAESAELSRQRLHREAQALAMLSHPNVVAVHDVGRLGDEIFLAMEFVEGETLSQWLKRGPRSPGEVVRVMCAAGAGLSAAHKAGLIHRDFKPANVMLGDDGRVRVLDFGLVRSTGARTDIAPRIDSALFELPVDEFDLTRDLDVISDSSSDSITRIGARVGTPVYMAPEQYAAEDTDARSDVFSFCVVLYEALYGKRPFKQKTLDALERAVRKGDIDPPQADAAVPGWLEPIWRRGMAADPRDRYPDMDGVLAALSADPYRRRRRVLTALGILALMVAAAVAGSRLWRGEAAESPCRDAKARLAGIWDTDIAARVQRAFLATERPHAQDTSERVTRQLDDYADAWTAMHTQACQATRVIGEQSDAMLDARMNCLNRHRAKLAGLSQLFADHATPAVVDGAVQAIASLPTQAACADTDALAARVPPADNDATRAAVDKMRTRIDALDALRVAGDFKRGIERARAIVTDARALKYQPVLAEALYIQGTLQLDAGYDPSIEPILREAAHAAARSRDDRLFAEIQISLLGVVGEQQAEKQDAAQLRWVTENAIARAGSPPRLQAAMLTRLGDVFWRQGDYDAAISLHQQSLTIQRDALGDTDSHRVANTYQSLGRIHWTRGTHDVARDYIERALDIQTRRLGPRHPEVGRLWGNIGSILVEQREYAEARRHLEQSLDIIRATLGDDNADVAGMRNNLGDVLARIGEHTDARSHIQSARDVLAQLRGAQHPYVGACWQNLAGLERAQGSFDKALDNHHKAQAIFESALGDKHPYVAFPLTGIGMTYLAMNEPTRALAPLERALALREPNRASAAALSDTRFALARALWQVSKHGPAAPSTRVRALSLARQARDHYRGAGRGFASDARDVDAWLDERASARTDGANAAPSTSLDLLR